jgi:hypothetical protein
MTRYYYDLHIHSCLSPCADNDMTPNNIAGMGTLAGLNVMALTDHNSCKNCPAFFAAANTNGIVPIAGMELTTAEDIHVVCLFPELADAMAFDEYVSRHRMLVPNRTEIFGDQLILDENDEPVGTEPYYLHPASDITIEQAPETVAAFGGVCWPAHVDREANGAIAVLGDFPEGAGFRCAEFYNQENTEPYLNKYPALRSKRILISSDAHNLWSIRDKSAYFGIPDDIFSAADVRREIFRQLKSEGPK